MLAQNAGNSARLSDTRHWQKEIPAHRKQVNSQKSAESMEKLADCYRLSGELTAAEEWYRQSIETGNKSTECILNYAKVLQENGKYQEAKGQIKLYEALSGNHLISEKFIASCEMALKAKNDENRYTIRPLTRLNTPADDLIAVCNKEEIVFATRGGKGEIGKLGKPGKSAKDYDIYRARKNTDGSIAQIRPMKGGINSKADDIPSMRMPDSDILLFTRSVPMLAEKSIQKSKGPSPNKGGHVWGAKTLGENQSESLEMPFLKADGHTNLHPAIHPSGAFMVFASDRPGGMGGMDLYLVHKTGSQWSEPINLGPQVNSAGDDVFPSFNQAGNLFFASDGHVGFGGLDLFTTDFESGASGGVQNMGAGINSSRDDFGIVWDATASSGYFSSNRQGSTGDDIFMFSRQPGIVGQVFDGLSREPVPGSIVRIRDVNGNQKIVLADGAGQFSEGVKSNSGYILTVDAPGFVTYRDTVWTRDIPQGKDLNMNVFLEVEQVFEMKGQVFDEITGIPLGNSEIQILGNGGLPKQYYSGADSADYRFRLKPGDDYVVVFKQESYVPRIMNLSLKDFRGVESRDLDVPLKKGNYVLLQGQIREEMGRNAVDRASVLIVNNQTQEVVDSTFSLRNGTFMVAIPWDSTSNYSVIGSKGGFVPASLHLDRMESQEFPVELTLRNAEYGLDHNHKVIYYGFNQSQLDLLSKKDLNEIYVFLTQNPEAKLEIRSHTDARGSKQYNLELSRRRSESVVQFIKARRNLPADRFISWGFGEEYLMNKCADGVDCSEEDHARNRRTDLKFVEK